MAPDTTAIERLAVVETTVQPIPARLDALDERIRALEIRLAIIAAAASTAGGAIGGAASAAIAALIGG